MEEKDVIELKSRQFKSGKININIENFFKKKIQFNSAFDHKGSKHFLHSKKAALQQIVLDDNDSSNNDSDTQSGSNLQKKYLKNRHPQTCITNKSQSTNNIVNVFNFNNNLRNRTQDSKEQNNRKENLIRTLVTNELNVHKKLNKNFSSQELKMFQDKEISKIKPIKKVKKEKNDNENKQRVFPFVEGENSIDSSLFNMVSQIK
jgi:hypothetical protein